MDTVWPVSSANSIVNVMQNHLWATSTYNQIGEIVVCYGKLSLTTGLGSTQHIYRTISDPQVKSWFCLNVAVWLLIYERYIFIEFLILV